MPKQTVLFGGLIISLTAVSLAACGAKSDSPNTTSANSTNRPTAPAMVPGRVLTGSDAQGDWTTDAPGVRRRLTLADLPPDYATPSVDNGPAHDWAA